MISPSLNSLAESRDLSAYSSWKIGTPAGYFPLERIVEGAAFFKEQGFLVIENALTAPEIEEIREETARICRGERGMFGGLNPNDPSLSDDEIIKNYLCIHFPHKVSEIMLKYVAHQAFVKTLTQIIGPNVKCMQSMLFVKSAGKPGQAWHQDEIYIPTRDRSLTGGWIALDDANVENGCLWVIPGSQRRGVLYEQEWHGDSRFDCSLESRRFPYSNDDAVPVEVKAGSIVFFNGYLLHRSLPNYREAGYRRALVNHYMSAESYLPWFHQADKHIAITDARDILMVAGEDPYEWKGVVDLHRGHVRPDGQGGCGNLEYNKHLPEDDD